MAAFLQQVDRNLQSMTRDEVDALYRHYLTTKFDEIEAGFPSLSTKTRLTAPPSISRLSSFLVSVN
nr:hypothetical protein [Pseudoxanthomonas sp. J35]